MGRKLFQAERNTFLVLVKVENNHIDLLIKFDNLFRMVDTAPGEVSNVNQSIHTSQVDKHTIRGNIFHAAFEDLTFFKLGNDFSFLNFKLCLNEGFVRDHHVFVFMVDFHHFEIHGFAHIDVIITDRFDINL